MVHDTLSSTKCFYAALEEAVVVFSKVAIQNHVYVAPVGRGQEKGVSNSIGVHTSVHCRLSANIRAG